VAAVAATAHQTLCRTSMHDWVVRQAHTCAANPPRAAAAAAHLHQVCTTPVTYLAVWRAPPWSQTLRAQAGWGPGALPAAAGEGRAGECEGHHRAVLKCFASRSHDTANGFDCTRNLHGLGQYALLCPGHSPHCLSGADPEGQAAGRRCSQHLPGTNTRQGSRVHKSIRQAACMTLRREEQLPAPLRQTCTHPVTHLMSGPVTHEPRPPSSLPLPPPPLPPPPASGLGAGSQPWAWRLPGGGALTPGSWVEGCWMLRAVRTRRTQVAGQQEAVRRQMCWLHWARLRLVGGGCWSGVRAGARWRRRDAQMRAAGGHLHSGVRLASGVLWVRGHLPRWPGLSTCPT
jgi:hypothetical protein